MRTIYLDYNATAPARAEAMEAFARASAESFGNASSAHHTGRAARRALDDARETLAESMGAEAREIVFTGGGTEADNLAILGVASARGPGHLVASAIEHPAVLEACRHLQRNGFELTLVPPDPSGRVDPDRVVAAILPRTILVTVMRVNNETGVIQPIDEIAALVRERGVPFHTDAVQAFGRLPVDVSSTPADLVSISGHKFGAPKGCGALFVRRGLRLDPVAHGGGQEGGRRSGTYNVPAAAAMAVAARLAVDECRAEAARQADLRDRLEREVLERIPGAAVNGRTAARVANTSNLRFPGADGEALVLELDALGIAISSASACAAAWRNTSHVLTAMGLPPRDADDSVRVSLGRGSTEEDITALVEALPTAVGRLRAVVPSRPR